MPAYSVEMRSGNDLVSTSSKVKRNIFFKDCSADDTQFNKSDKRSKISNSRSMVINNSPRFRSGLTPNKSPSNIIVINGAWVQGSPTKYNANGFSGEVDEVSFNTTSVENNSSWIFDDQNSDGGISLGLVNSKANCQQMSIVENNANYSDDSLTRLSDYSLVPSRNVDTRVDDGRDHGNLSWLFNYELKEHISLPDLDAPASLPESEVTMRVTPPPPPPPPTPVSLPVYQGVVDQQVVGLCASDSKSNTRKFHQGQPNPKAVSKTCHGVVKPPFTYSELIEKALAETGELTVSELYHWISFHFPFYQPNDDRWKNSVRHNLSINPHFRKGRKSSQGAGHLWSLAPNYTRKEELDSEMRPKKLSCHNIPKDNQVITLQEVEAATASIEENKENRELPESDVYYYDSRCYSDLGDRGDHCDEGEYAITILETAEDRGLARTAEEILNGVKKDVEVQYVVPVHDCDIQVVHGNASDFLNPVSMQEVVEECGLGFHLGATGIGADGTSFMITDINPETLGINIVETITPDLFSDSDAIDIS